MLRAVALAARLDFTIDPPIGRRDPAPRAAHRASVAGAAARGVLQDPALGRVGAGVPPARRGRLLERSRAGAAGAIAAQALWQSLAALDAYRHRFEAMPETLTNPILLGTLLVPLGFTRAAVTPRRSRTAPSRSAEPPATARAGCRCRGATSSGCGRSSGCSAGCSISSASPRAQRALMHRGPFREALTWLEIHGAAPEVVEHWRGFSKRTVLPQARRATRTEPRRGAGDGAATAAGARPPPELGV